MKKITALFISVLMVLSVLTIVPVSASATSTWPYIFESFEDKFASLSVSGSDPIKYVSDTPDGSDWAYQFNVSPDANRNLLFTRQDAGVTIHNGDTVSLSMDLKLSAAIDGSTTMYVHYLADGNENFDANGYLTMDGKNRPTFSIDLDSTSWQKAGCKFVYSGADVNINGSMGITVVFPKQDETYSVTIDNLEIMAQRESYVDEAPANRVLFENDFTENMSGITYTGTKVDGSGISVVTPADDPEEKVLQMVDNDKGGHVKFTVNAGEPLKQGKYYALTYRARIVESFDNSSGSPVAFASNQGCKHRFTMQGALCEFSRIFNTNTWVNCAMLFYCDDKVLDSDGIFEMQWWIKYQSTGSDTGIYQLDDIKFEEINGLINGTFDYSAGEYKEAGSAVNYASIGDDPVGGWQVENGKFLSANSSTVNSESKSMGILYFNSIDGSSCHTNKLWVEPDNTYKISGWGRPAAANSSGTLEIGVNYTYTDDTAANSVVLGLMETKSATYTGYRQFVEEFSVPANAATAELYVKHLSTVGEGQDISRLDSDSKNLAYYFDEWELYKLAPTYLPAVSGVGHSGYVDSGELINLTYNFTTGGIATDLSYVKLYEDDICIYSGRLSDNITLPVFDESKSYKFVITPIDGSYNYGKTVEYELEIGNVASADGVTVSFNDVGNVPEAKVRIDSNFAELHPGVDSINLIVTAYDANGKMLATEIEPVSTVPSTTKTITLSGVDYTQVATLKCFVWSDDDKIAPIKNSVTRIPAQSISCWGDSLTQGDRSQNMDIVKAVDERFADYSDISYSEVLAELSGKQVNNFGCGGDNVTSIACRQGGLDMLIGTEFTIPADTTTVDIDLDSENGIFINTLFQGRQNANLNPVVINGVEGTLSTVKHDDFYQLTEGSFHYAFTRTEAGEAVTVPANTKVIPASVREDEPGYAKKDIVVLFMGANGGYNNSLDTLFDILDSMIESLEYEDKEYVIVAWPHNSLSTAVSRGEAFEERYGDRVVNLSRLFRTDVENTFEKYGFSLTETDESDLAAGNLPTSLLIYDGMHFNAVGNYILGCEIYEKMLDLGILTK